MHHANTMLLYASGAKGLTGMQGKYSVISHTPGLLALLPVKIGALTYLNIIHPDEKQQIMTVVEIEWSLLDCYLYNYIH